MTIYGYARVSTDGQTLAAQDAALNAAGCAKVYGEKQSGAKADRPQLAKLLRRLEPGDVLMVTRLDRLARSTRDLLNILHTLGERSIGFKSLADTWADTTTPHGRLLVTMLAGIAEFERELIKARTGEGRKRAQARGVRFGRPPALTAHQRQEALKRLAAGETQTDIARSYNVSHVTIGRLQGAMLRPFEDAAVVALSSGRTEHLHEDERCPNCGALLILVGRDHLCRPRPAVTKPSVTNPPVTKSGGRPPISEKAMTGAERMRRLRATRRALAHMRTV